MASLWKLVYLGSNISSTESGVSICIGKARNAIDRLSTINKMGIPPSFNCINTIVWLHLLESNETLVEKTWWKVQNDVTSCF